VAAFKSGDQTPKEPFAMDALDPKTTALVLIDLQKGVVARELAPRSGRDVLATSKRLAERFRAAGAPVVLVRVAFAPDYADALRQPVEKAMARPAGGMPADWAEYADGLAQAGDILVTKHQWGAFHGTDLDVQLRRRRIETIVLGGIATNMGVESTARQAWEHGYRLIVAEDACATMTAEMHAFAMDEIMPRLGFVRRAADMAFS
jgi:nicotinamidase-related amidase